MPSLHESLKSRPITKGTTEPQGFNEAVSGQRGLVSALAFSTRDIDLPNSGGTTGRAGDGCRCKLK
jgi:hypothetical protein